MWTMGKMKDFIPVDSVLMIYESLSVRELGIG